jgi:hypothetical protein
MPTKKIDRTPLVPHRPPPCYDPDHDPPKNYVFAPGEYVHYCPSCGKTTYFTIQGATL